MAPWRHIEGAKVKLHAYLASSVPSSGLSTPGEKGPVIHNIEGTLLGTEAHLSSPYLVTY